MLEEGVLTWVLRGAIREWDPDRRLRKHRDAKP